MAFKTREEYYADLRAMRPNVFQNGKFIQDIVSDPLTRGLVETEAKDYDLLQDPQYDDVLKAQSTLSGKTVARWHTLMCSAEDLRSNARVKRLHFNKTGTCGAGTCTGWNIFNVLWSVTHDIDAEDGGDYHKRLEQWLLNVEDRSLKITGALTDAKGDRSKKAGQQVNPDANLRVTEIRPEGIVVNGAKVMIAHAAASHEIMCLPGTAYNENEKEYVVAFAVPRDIPGLTLVECSGGAKEGWDELKHGSNASYLLFENCFIPKERVFMCGEWKHSGDCIGRFTANYRACIGACVAGQGEMMIGAGVLMARANGLSAGTFKEKITDMSLLNALVYGLGMGAALEGKKHPSGTFYADPRLANANKVYVAKSYAELRRLCQDMGGGIAETGTFPAWRDCVDPTVGPGVMKYLQAGSGVSGETRARAARLSEWLVRSGSLAFVHGGGSPDGARIGVRAATPIEYYVQCAADLAGITEKVNDPAPPAKK
jgi:4-hydroxybutyryl-CoA dehydratase/vinylacetyl-CoA-Delta-isomerase